MRFTHLFLAILLAAYVLSVSFTTSVSINNEQNTFTDDNLVCRWNVSGDATVQNISWYRNGALNFTINRNDTSNTTSQVNATATTRGEVWLCQVSIGNGTDTVVDSDNVSIENSAPFTPTVFNSSGVPIGNTINLTEDQSILLDMNSSDTDTDTLTFFFLDTFFCSVTDSTVGTVNCTVDHDDVINGSSTELVTQTQYEFWVRDTPPNTKSSSLLVNFTLVPVNDVPNVTTSNQTVNVSDVLNVTFSASDEEEDYPLNASLVVAQTSAGISDDVQVTIEGNSTIRVTYQTSPTEFDDVGNHTVTFNLTDARNASSLYNFSLEILTVNRNPYFTNISPNNSTYVIDQGDNLLINIGANDFDTDDRNETITFSDNTSLFNIVTVSSTASNVSNATGFINLTPDNGDVGNHSVLITITDAAGLTNTTVLNFTINNVNEPPVIYNQSFNSSNTGGNVNITPLVAYLQAAFIYQINFTDPDLVVNDSLIWSDNTSTFNVSAGLIQFTPSSPLRNETINITVTDSEGLSDSRIITLEIRNNTAPYFNQSFPQLNCSEKVTCFFNISQYSFDDDAGDSVVSHTSTNGSLSSYDLNTSTGIINFTPLQTEIGNYTLNVTITDTRGAQSSQILNVSINNTDDYPEWTRFNFSAQTIVENKQFTFELRATDDDFNLSNSTENLTFSTNLTGATVTFQQVTNGTSYALFSFTPNASDVGNQTLQLNVTDTTNLTNSTVISIEVLAETDPPNVTFIQPYGNASNDSLVEDWLNVTGQVVLEENVSLSENTSGVRFEVNVTDDATPLSQLNFTWFYDDVINATGTGTSGKSITLDFDFFSSGSHNVSVRINDTTLENTTWSWNLDVADVNRPPVLLNNLTENLTVETTTTYPAYFRQFNGKKFYDPDADLDSNGTIDGSENLSLTYSYNPTCSVATITFTNDDLVIEPLSIGSCTIEFTATDSGGLSNTSNQVTITVTDVPSTSQSTTSSSSGGGGGGGSSNTQTEFVPLEQEVDKPKPLSIIAPQLVTVYRNRTVVVPIRLHNNWTDPLEGIRLSATTNASNVLMQFDQNYLPSLAIGETREVYMTVGNYRLGENFEVTVHANVTEPLYNDQALILFNSIEQAEEGENVQVKVTFAQDLLSENSECQELNEVLLQASSELSLGDVRRAAALVDSVINGCKYLISRTQPTDQRPGIIRTPLLSIEDSTASYVVYISLGVFLIIGIVGMLYYHYRTRDAYDF